MSTLILTQRINVVNYDSENGKTTIIDKIKDLFGNKNINKDAKNFVNEIRSIESIESVNIESIAGRFEHLNESVIQAASVMTPRTRKNYIRREKIF